MLTSDRSIDEYVIENFRVHTGTKFVKIILLMYISIRYYFCVINIFSFSCRYSSWKKPPKRYSWFNKLNLKKAWMTINFLLYKDNRYHLSHFLQIFISKWWKEISDDEIFWFFFFEMILFETRSIKVSKFNFQSHWRIRILKEPSVVNACFKFYLYFTNWQFFEFLQYFSSSTLCALSE